MVKPKRKSLVKTLAFILITLAVCMLLIQVVYLYKYHQSAEARAIDSLEALASQVESSVEYELKSIETSAISLFRNPKIADILLSGDALGPPGAVEEVLGLNNSLCAMYLLDTQLNPVAASSKSIQEDTASALLGECLALASQLPLSEESILQIEPVVSDEGSYFTHFRPILYKQNFDPNDTDNTPAQVIGYCIFICRLSSFEQNIGSDSGDYEITIVQNSVPVSSSGSEIASASQARGTSVADYIEQTDEHLVASRTLPGGWEVFVTTGKQEMNRQLYSLTLTLGICLIAITIAAIVLAAVYLSKNMLRPIKRIEAELGAVTGYGSSHRLPETPNNEIGEIASRINLMLDRLDTANSEAMQAQQEKYESEILMRKAQINYIHAQVNPHFLCNSLEAVCGMAAMERHDLVIDTCQSLASLFRYSIRPGESVSLEEELKYAENYFYVMNQRYRGKLELQIDACDRARKTVVPKMILQPILENSLRHGALSLIDHGFVSIKSEFVGDDLIIKIRDNGKGIPEEMLPELNERCAVRNDCISDEEGLGLQSVSTRLKIMFGDEYGVTLTSTEGQFTEVTLKIGC